VLLRTTNPAPRTLYPCFMFWHNLKPVKLDMTQFMPIPEGGYLVGGAVRDALLGAPFNDLDWLVADPEKTARETAKLLQGSAFPVDQERGVWRVMAGVDVRDYILLDGSLEQNLRERDFTINAMAVASDGRVIDPLGGRGDLKVKQLRMVSEANLRADPLRVLRAVRFVTCLSSYHPRHLADPVMNAVDSLRAVRLTFVKPFPFDFKLDVETEQVIRKVVLMQLEQTLPLPAWERIKEELEKIILCERAGFGFKLLDDLGMLRLYLPELTEGRGVSQGSLHHLDVLNHGFEALHQLLHHFPDADAALRWATLLHDVGKPRTKQEDDGLSFHGHAELGGELAEDILSRLRYASDLAARVKGLVHYHMLPLPHQRSDAPDAEQQLVKEIRRFVHRRRELLPDLLQLMLADREAARGKRASAASRQAYRLAIGRIIKALDEAPPKVPLLTGQDVMTLLNLGPGPRVGEALTFIKEAEAVGDVTTREEAAVLLGNYARAQNW
jgi:poly(A) polymerase